MIRTFGLALVTALATAGQAAAQSGPGVPYHDHMWGGGYGMGIFGAGLMLLFWGVVIALAVLVVQRLRDRDGGGSRSSSALDILKERLARGEIDPEEYQARRRALDE